MSGSILIISGPSGSGKSSLIKEVLKNIPNSVFSISTTTREKREGETHGINYFFIDKESFQKDVENGLFLEWANVHGNFYGTSIKQIDSFLKQGKMVVLDIDVQGFIIAKEKLGKFITSIFLTTKSQSELEERLILRGTDKAELVDIRLKNAFLEMNCMDKYDYLIINDDFGTALKNTLSIAASANLKCALVDKDKFMLRWSKN